MVLYNDLRWLLLIVLQRPPMESKPECQKTSDARNEMRKASSEAVEKKKPSNAKNQQLTFRQSLQVGRRLNAGNDVRSASCENCDGLFPLHRALRLGSNGKAHKPARNSQQRQV